MLAEGQMLEQPTNQAQRLSLARAQALKASGAEGPGFVGAMHWQAAHIAGPLRALKVVGAASGHAGVVKMGEDAGAALVDAASLLGAL